MSKNKEELVVDFDKVIKICNLVDEKGISLCGVALSVDEVGKDKKAKNIKQFGLEGNAHIYSRGGATVLEITYEREFSTEYNRLVNVLKQFAEDISEEDLSLESPVRFLTFVLTPTLLAGTLTIALTDMVYFSTSSGKQLKVSIVFNNEGTELYAGDVIDVNEIKTEVDSIIRATESEMDEELLRLDSEIKKLSDENEYGNSFRDGFEKLNLSVGNREIEDVVESPLRKRETFASSDFRRHTEEE